MKTLKEIADSVVTVWGFKKMLESEIRLKIERLERAFPNRLLAHSEHDCIHCEVNGKIAVLKQILGEEK